MKCVNCGTEFEGAFCPSCGTPVNAQQNQYTQPQPQNPVYNQGYQPYQQPIVKTYCTSCGAEMNMNEMVCTKCGCPKGVGKKHCAACGNEINSGAVMCTSCGAPVKKTRSKLVALLLAIFFGTFGVSSFYLGYNKYAIIQLCVSVVLCWTGLAPLGMYVWAIVQAVMAYMDKMPDADGNALKD